MKMRRKICILMSIFMLMITFTPYVSIKNVYAQSDAASMTTAGNVLLMDGSIEVTLKDFISTGDYDWITLYSENFREVGDGEQYLWWEYLPDLGIKDGGTFTFNTSKIFGDRKNLFVPGKSYKFVIFYDNGYDIAVESNTFMCVEAAIEGTAAVNNKSGKIDISGNITSGAGKHITVVVSNQDGQIDYLNQTVSGEDGFYSFSYTLDEKTEGNYVAKVGGEGIASPAEINFSYKPDNSGGNPGGNTGPGTIIDNEDKVTEDKDANDKIPSMKVKPDYDKNLNTASASVKSDDLGKLFEKAEKDNRGNKNIAVEIPAVDGAKTYNIMFSANDLANSTDDKKIIQLRTPIANVAIPSNVLTGTKLAETKNIELSISDIDKNELNKELKDKIGNRPAVDISILADRKPAAWSSTHTPLRVSFKYAPSEQELKNAEHIVIWNIDGSGNISSIPSGRYDKKSGMVTFDIYNLGKYAVGYVNKTFKDMDGHSWAKNAVEVLASKGIVNGTSNTTYSPSLNITRADFITLLVKALDLRAEADTNFSDIKSGSYFEEAVGIAKKLGIVQGTGNNTFKPNDQISRQDMMVMAAKALSIAEDEEVKGGLEDLKAYDDTAVISSYAVESIASLVKRGIISGSSGKINPKDNLTRAEASVVIYKLYNLDMNN